MATDFLDRSDAIEECYEYMLAYAGQGLSEEGAEIRKFLDRAATALVGLKESCAAEMRQTDADSANACTAFVGVLDRDADDSLAAIQMVLAQPAITSQIIDNLNASIHLRALLTDLFLVGEVLNSRTASAARKA